MDKVFILLFMIFLHVVDDYYLQSILASMKQRSWWEKNAPDDLYKNDYLMALGMHAFSWTFMVMLPLAFCIGVTNDFLFLFMVNFCIHYITDDTKANQHTINLIQDQCVHLVQIIATYVILVLI